MLMEIFLDLICQIYSMVLPASVCADFCVEEADASSSKPYLS
jgi:hypothetical protein